MTSLVPRIQLTLEYDGTDYVGWQSQANGPSIQDRVEQALQELLGQRTPVVAAGRTDAGVHALGQVIAFDAPRALPMKAYWMGLNGILPPDIAVVRAEEAAPGFDPRRWAEGKHYRYLISNRRIRSPLRRRTHWELYAPLDFEAMKAAAPALVGRHDFSAFRAADCQSAHAVREVRRLELVKDSEDVIRFDVEGTAFVKHMVRNLIGTLVEVGKGRQPASWVRQVLESKDRTLAGQTAPAHGLTMVQVFYGDGPRAADEDDE